MANCYQEIKDLKNAEEMLQKVIYFLLYLYEKNYKKEEIQGELKKSVISYINFIQKNNLDTISKTIFFNLLEKTIDNKQFRKYKNI